MTEGQLQKLRLEDAYRNARVQLLVSAAHLRELKERELHAGARREIEGALRDVNHAIEALRVACMIK